MYFMLDENVPQVVADMLKRLGHKADFIREYAPPGSPDSTKAIIDPSKESTGEDVVAPVVVPVPFVPTSVL